MPAPKIDQEKVQKVSQTFRRALGIAPYPEEDGEGFLPSAFARWVAIDNQTDYHPYDYEEPYTGPMKILALCTEEKYMTMSNEKAFSTGNHPVETMLPIMHMEQAGFQVDICTPTGRPTSMEMWAMPERDKHVHDCFKTHYTQFENPMSLVDICASLSQDTPYAAVFVPGGHGSMLGLPTNSDVGKLIDWVKDNDRWMITICHGSAALLASASKPYQDYNICSFPDSVDRMAPKIGYIPGPMPWFLGEKLVEQGLTLANKRASGMVKKDRKLLSGDSPKAANALGKLAVDCLMEEWKMAT